MFHDSLMELQIFDWKPDSYSGDDLPKDMPEKLQKKIKALSAIGAKQVRRTARMRADLDWCHCLLLSCDSVLAPPQLNSVWITCQPEYVADRENVGPMEFYSPDTKLEKGAEFGMLPNYYFPYQKQSNFTSPFIFVRFTKPARKSMPILLPFEKTLFSISRVTRVCQEVNETLPLIINCSKSLQFTSYFKLSAEPGPTTLSTTDNSVSVLFTLSSWLTNAAEPLDESSSVVV